MVGLSLCWVNHGGSIQGRSGADPCSYPVRGIVLDIQKLYFQTEWGFSVHSPPSLLVLLPHSHLEAGMTKKPKTTKHGTVKKIIKSPDPSVPEKAEVQVHEADELYKEIRIENTLEDERGKKVKLKEDAPVDITVEADTKATTPDNNEKR
jgi:hypothetical protein